MPQDDSEENRGEKSAEKKNQKHRALFLAMTWVLHDMAGVEGKAHRFYFF